MQNWIIEATRARPLSFGAPTVLHGADVNENTPTALRTFGEEADAKSGDRTYKVATLSIPKMASGLPLEFNHPTVRKYVNLIPYKYSHRSLHSCLSPPRPRID